MKCIGEKDFFRIEYELIDKNDFYNAKVLLWIKGNPLGDIENPSPIYGVYVNLKYIIEHKAELSTNLFIDKTPAQIYSRLFPCDSFEEEEKLPVERQEELLFFDRFRFDFNQSFDIYLIRIYIENENVCFLWKLFEKYIKDFPEYNSELNLVKIPIEKLETVFLDFQKDLASLNII